MFFAQATITRLIIENDSWYSLRLLTIFVVQASALRDHREDRLDVVLLGAVLLCGLEVLRMLSALAGGELVTEQQFFNALTHMAVAAPVGSFKAWRCVRASSA